MPGIGDDMTGGSHPRPVPNPDDEALRAILAGARTIAVVGASGSPQKDAHEVPAYLQDHGYDVIPVNPAHDEVLGHRAADGVRDLGGHVDVVDVFRPAEEAADIARAAVDIGADVLWLQLGIASDEAAQIAASAGLTIVMDACMRETHARLFPQVGS
jgi:predicted CoA-binding protein